jgi:hypothetical protein
MRSGSIPAPAASSMMILIRQWWTTRCAHASWQASSGLAERRTSCGPRWNVLIWRYEDSASHLRGRGPRARQPDMPRGRADRSAAGSLRRRQPGTRSRARRHALVPPASARPGSSGPGMSRPAGVRGAGWPSRTAPGSADGPGPRYTRATGDSGKAPVHDHEHSRGRGSEPDRQLQLAAAGPVHCCVDLRVSSGLGQRHHPHLGEPGHLPARVLRPAESPPVRLRLRSVQDEPVHGGEPHPAVERPPPARPGPAARSACGRPSRWPVLPGAGEPAAQRSGQQPGQGCQDRAVSPVGLGPATWRRSTITSFRSTMIFAFFDV